MTLTDPSANRDDLQKLSLRLAEVWIQASRKSCIDRGIIRSADVLAVMRAAARRVLSASAPKRAIDEREDGEIDSDGGGGGGGGGG